MNRVYNNEGIIMACIVHILRERDMDIVLLYLVSTILIDNQLSAELYGCIDFRQLSNRIKSQGLISRKLDSFGPYFMNAIIILKQSNTITVSEGVLQLIDKSFPNGNLSSRRLGRIINNANRLLDICKDLSTEEIYNELNVFL